MSNDTCDSSKFVPLMHDFDKSINVNISGSKIGKLSTGYNVPFELAFAIIAAKTVEAEAIPKLPRMKAIINISLVRRLILILGWV